MPDRSAPVPMIDAADAALLLAGEHPDPFSVLGPTADGRHVVALVPGAERVWAVNDTDEAELAPRVAGEPIFCGELVPFYRLRIEWPGGALEEREDPYRFDPVLGEIDEYLIGEGRHLRLWEALGAHLVVHERVAGVHFAVWAPNALRVSLVGDFNAWNETAHPMRARGATGVWEIFIPGLEEGAVYKYDVRAADGAQLPQKADPVGFGSEHPPATGSVVRALGRHAWSDREWLAQRAETSGTGAPMSVYEVHLGSWRRADPAPGAGSAVGTAGERRPLSYLELATELVEYAADLGFTHIEVLPVSEHPFDGSWGYQPIGLFAPTVRYGTPEEFAAFVDAAHARGLGVIADWVPGHFPTDQHGLGRFDGTALYEHRDPREGFHPDWNTLIFNYGRPEVQGYLVSNALYWLHEYHLDGLRVDAVASMIYRDYSRRAGEWIPNRDGGRENYEAIEFLRRVNIAAYGELPGVAMIAEESTTFPGVTHPVRVDDEGAVSGGGLGFGYKWNLGWMNDSLAYFGRDPVYRKYHQDQLTFGITYAFTE
ncbi:MAG: 1,4-alpha-glucan branching protein GlgB, partial [Leucobacter sp.]